MLTTSPGDLSARQNFLSSAEAMASRFNSINGVMTDLRDATNLKVLDTVQKINDSAKQIAELNNKIVASSNNSALGAAPNELLDERDRLISELSEQVQLTRVDLDNGSVNLFLANGRAIVVKDKPFDVITQVDPADNENLLVGMNIVEAGVSNLVTFEPKSLGTGALSGFLQFRENELAQYQNTVGLMAANLSFTVNELQLRGVDLTNLQAGNLTVGGSPIFGFAGSSDYTDPVENLRALSKAVNANSNTGGAFVELNKADFSRLSAQDFEVRVVDVAGTPTPSYRVLGSGAAFTALAAPSAADIAAGYTGGYKIPDSSGNPLVTFDFNTGGGAFAIGDTFTIYPTRNAAKNILVDMKTPAGVATAVRNGQDTVLAGGGTKARDPATGDNDNSLLFAALQNSRTMFKTGNSAGVSIGDSFNQLVSRIGNKTRELEVATDSRSAILEQVRESRDAFSGVNMDEEAANLLKYQQAYQASGRVISLSKELFELVLNLFG
ncbi:MAG: hypothetical protein HC848_01065 [Limnobacter sp.]|nr:hypothetical protein [Limnobacter sp.]